jgi:hypothetical protein
MTAATGRVFGIHPIHDEAIPPAFRYDLSGSVAPYRNWMLGLDSSGYAVAQAAGVTDLIPLGFAQRDQASDATAGDAEIVTRQIVAAGFVNSTGASDALLSTDICVPAWAVDNQTVGRKSNLSGTNRSMAGLALGLDAAHDNAPIIFHGPIGWMFARLAHMGDAYVGGSYQIADAAANTTTAEAAMVRVGVHGTVTAVQFIGAAVAADNTDYVTITIAKRDGAGGGATTVATYDSRAANQGAVTAFVPAAFALSGTAAALRLLETDVLTITVAKGNAGKVLTGAIRVVQRVI